MSKILVPVLLPLILWEAIVPVVTARLNSVQVASYRRAQKTKNGPWMCALDLANETTSSSSQQDCSVKCARDATCTGFNIKNWVTCAVYNYKPRIKERDATCEFHEVFTISIFLTFLDIVY